MFFRMNLYKVTFPMPQQQVVLQDKKIKKFVEEYHNEGLFEDRGERFHSGFENFKHKVVVKYPEKLQVRLLKYVKSLEN